MLVPGETGSTALLVQDTANFRVVDLADAPTVDLAQQVTALHGACAQIGAAGRVWTTADEMTVNHLIFDCLEWLWDHVAAPILDAIAQTPTTSHRIWWSPLGEFALLPIHACRAASAQSQPDRADHPRAMAVGGRTRDECISAHHPRIRAHAEPPPSPLRLLYVSTDAASKTLGYSDAEYAAACAALPAVGMTELRAQNATIDAVRKAIPEHRLLHVTAHGELRDTDSLQSGSTSKTLPVAMFWRNSILGRTASIS
jgi:CHAT domain